MRPLIFLLLGFLSFIATDVKASLICPPDITLTCDSDLSRSEVTGYPILGGLHVYLGARYFDEKFTTKCNVGYVTRTWYVDLDNDKLLGEFEPHCDQTITLIDIDAEIIFYAPDDITLECIDEIPNTTVTWIAGPCDHIGSSSEDKIFNISTDACYKILRKHTIIDWCEYQPGNPNWSGKGIYEFDQYIKVIDGQAPIIKSCEEIEFAIEKDCTTEVILKNSATDIGNCPSAELFWEVEIDLWANGDVDFLYSYLAAGIYNIPTKANNEEVTIKLPELVVAGNHKIYWKVRDGCGNWKTCSTLFKTVDKKAPTPYCNQVVYANFDGSNNMDLTMTADMFNVGSFDNCTAPENLKFAFSNDITDNTYTINCFNQGFQFFNIYTFDEKGNSDFCIVYMLVFDNGSCSSRFAPQGTISLANGNHLSGVELTASRPQQLIGNWMSDTQGLVQTDEVPLFDDIQFTPNLNGLNANQIDIEDYTLLIDHLLGKKSLANITLLAADLDDNKRISSGDLRLLKNYILGKSNKFNGSDWAFIPNHKIDDFTLATHESFLKISEFDGDLDFVGVMKGNISDQEVDTSINRSISTVDFSIGNEFDGKIPVYANEGIELNGLQLSMNVYQFEGVVSGLINISNEDFYVDGSVLKMVITDIGNIEKELPLFYIQSTKVGALKGKGITFNYEKVVVNEATSTAKDILVYPNPSSTRITLNTSMNSTIQMLDVMGKTVEMVKLNDRSIDISGLPNGRYFIKQGNQYGSFIKIE